MSVPVTCKFSRLHACKGRLDDDGACRASYAPMRRVTPGQVGSFYCNYPDCIQPCSKLCYGCWSWVCFGHYKECRKRRGLRELLKVRPLHVRR